MITGKGQFICGNKKCSEKDELRTWEVNFAYIEDGFKKNALVKISKYNYKLFENLKSYSMMFWVILNSSNGALDIHISEVHSGT